ncbi:MAG: hypothetical protein JNJ65_17175 [Cyclobacteriaceae bacterium]|nr:hypothetical protein [Cyclobacteriaceae bacterium]
MKRAVCSWASVVMIFFFAQSSAQKMDEERMNRDLEVTENILSTIIKQKFDKRSFFPMEIKGEYREGLGVTFRLPYEINGPMIWNISPGMTVMDGRSFSYSFDLPDGEQAELTRVLDEEMRTKSETIRGTGRAKVASGRKINTDSMRAVSNDKVIEACKEFLADYGDLITQLPNNEKIIITNRGEGERIWYGAFVNSSKPSYLSVEAIKSDITQFRQGKMSKEQFLKGVKVINSEMDDELQPDLELLSSIFNRLYRRDLSKTYFTEENIYYERLKDYGVIYYMQVFSSNQNEYDRTWIMPTVGLNGLSQAERDAKVKALYPQFERDIKTDILEYGRTVKSLKPEEVLVFNIQITKCQDCAIPASVEVSVKASILSDYGAGKITKEAALSKIIVKKGSIQ